MADNVEEPGELELRLRSIERSVKSIDQSVTIIRRIAIWWLALSILIVAVGLFYALDKIIG
jgi:hypothetical protein